jgi:hypothetical protein
MKFLCSMMAVLALVVSADAAGVARARVNVRSRVVVRQQVQVQKVQVQKVAVQAVAVKAVVAHPVFAVKAFAVAPVVAAVHVNPFLVERSVFVGGAYLGGYSASPVVESNRTEAKLDALIKASEANTQALNGLIQALRAPASQPPAK